MFLPNGYTLYLPTPPKSYSTSSIGLLLTPFIVFFICLCSANAATEKPATQQKKGIPVTTTTAKTSIWPIELSAQGEIIPWEAVIISAKTAGLEATQVNFIAGDSVKKGQVLAQFDVRRLNAELKQANANTALAKANVDLANTRLKRFDLLEQNKTLSEQDYDIAVNQATTSKALYEQTLAAQMLAKIRLDDATLLAPDDGKILERNINFGEVPQTGAPLFKLLRQQKLQWIARLNADDLHKVKVGMKAKINRTTDSSLFGTVRSISPQLSSGSRLGIAHIIIEGSPELPVNTYAEGKILIGNQPAITIPAEGLVIKDGKTWVFRVSNNMAEQVRVQLGRRHNNEIELLTGINAGNIIALEGAGFLNHGDTLSIKTDNAKQSSHVAPEIAQ